MQDGQGQAELRRKLAREQRVIEHRLQEAVAPNAAGPVLGRAPVRYELAGRSRGVACVSRVNRLLPRSGFAAAHT
ncbi:MAG: hypothetical protein LC808_19175 [Actinobacteria bacterium]|nr:hypothetical protein [Actinomycetota bacterium]